MRFTDAILFVRAHIANRPILAAILILIVGVFSGRLLRQGDETTLSFSSIAGSEHSGNEQSQAAAGPCSMHPQIRSGKPGKCPICGMPVMGRSKPSTQGRVKTGHI